MTVSGTLGECYGQMFATYSGSAVAQQRERVWCQADQSSNPLPLKDRSHLLVKIMRIKTREMDFPGGSIVVNPPANAGDTGLTPGLGGFHMPQRK